MRNMSKTKVFLLVVSCVIIAVVIILLIMHNTNKTEATSGQAKPLAVEANVFEVEEQVVKVAVDTSVDATEEKEETVVKYKDKEIKIPKRTVAAAKDAEDGQKQKSGGETATVSSFENDGQYVGIDVSSWQGNINWPEVASSGVQFAMIRVGFRGYAEEGNIKEDAYFRQNVKGAVNNGIKVGIYFYSTARNEDEALQEAAWVVDKIKSYAITYPVAYDFEEFGMHRTASITGEQATNNAIAFLNYIGSQGFGTMMYANKNDITNRFQKGRLPYKFWLAHYITATDYTGSYQMWQRTSKGSVPGISGYVDMNIAYFGYGSVAKPKHTHDFENGTIIGKVVEPTCVETGYKIMRCKECSESQKIEIPATGKHVYGEWVINEEEGTKTRTCTLCKKKTETVKYEPEIGNVVNNEISNDVNNNTVTNNNSSGNENVVNEVVEPQPCEHVWGNGVITKNPTCTEKGIRTYTCSNCGETKTEEIDMLPHNYNSEGICDDCGFKDPDYKPPIENEISNET